MKSSNRIKNIAYAAVIAAIYVVLTYVTNAFGLANGVVQCRLSEALCVLPAFTPSAIYGLFVGCMLSNILTGCILPDVVFGSVATLVGAVGTYFLAKHKSNTLLLPLPCIAANTVIIPFVLKFAYGYSGGLLFFFVTVAAGEIISSGILGMILYRNLSKSKLILFK